MCIIHVTRDNNRKAGKALYILGCGLGVWHVAFVRCVLFKEKRTKQRDGKTAGAGEKQEQCNGTV